MFVAVPAATSTSPRGFVGLDLAQREDSEELTQLRERARTEGYAAGWAAGMRQASAKAAAELEVQKEAAHAAALDA